MLKISFNAVSARVHVRRGHPDTVWFDTDLPSSQFEWNDAGQFRTRVPAGTGAQWVKDTLGVDPKITDLDAED